MVIFLMEKAGNIHPNETKYVYVTPHTHWDMSSHS
jgi:hypothetical protein